MSTELATTDFTASGTLAGVDTLDRAVAALAEGRMVVVVDDDQRENECDLVVGAEDITVEQMAFMVRHGTGIVCVPMEGERLDQLRLPPMSPTNTEAHHTAFSVSVDHAGTSTGVSAADRVATVRALADPATGPSDLRRPGHIFPLRYCEGGTVRRAGHTEAAVDLLKMAGKSPVGVICELVNDDGTMCRPGDLAQFAREHDLPVVTVADLVRYRRATERLVVETGTALLPTTYGICRATAFRSLLDDEEHVALVFGDVTATGPDDPGVLVRVHSECLTGDAFGSLKCDCGTQLDQAMEMIAAEGRGIVVYLRGHEGRGIGLGHKLRAYALQERGRDTVDANRDLGLPVDKRQYGVGATIVAALGARRIRLITNNPAKYGGLQGFDLEIAGRVDIPPVVTSENLSYLRTKRDRMGHDIRLTGS
ncbi:bifunctional 3,4-dihydroxy-2-butanone-4-phosphate synthase/GTP cyclohydrolase II [Amycolatopsis sp. GM8]|uniref:bifunctional 3,4-dihydroxy-2-butanone-4-phosphate synthase/GTP cyclohydrolase II n=1 Tax=Amycolatopsis sp. GM8 TaxID=2896530 RepID=UPI0021039E6C|nr:bifunctional 3,4-dihydroxy-2-butanone-4-phosphate synthase/GTP cyclohydrolase II [Amycolatopsis sp. GM8]